MQLISKNDARRTAVRLNPVSAGLHEPLRVDAVSCTYSVDNFCSPMDSVIRTYDLDRRHFKSDTMRSWHSARGFCVIVHGDMRPTVITASKTEFWHSISDAAILILRAADCERNRSLRMTHFAFLPGKFPELSFRQCMQAVHLAHCFTAIDSIIVDVDERYVDRAIKVSMAIETELSTPLPKNLPALEHFQAKWKPEKVQLDPILSSHHLLEKAETGDTGSMTRLGQYYRFDNPILAMKWLFLAASRGSGLARTMLEHTKSRARDEAIMAAYRLSQFWLSELPKRVELNRVPGADPKHSTWLLWKHGTATSR